MIGAYKRVVRFAKDVKISSKSKLQASTSTELWLSATGTCPGEEVAFKEAKMSRTRQIQVWAFEIMLMMAMVMIVMYGVLKQGKFRMILSTALVLRSMFSFLRFGPLLLIYSHPWRRLTSTKAL